MKHYILFLRALLDDLDRVRELLGRKWPELRAQVYDLLIDLIKERDERILAAQVNRIYRGIKGTSAEALVSELFQKSKQQAGKSEEDIRFKVFIKQREKFSHGVEVPHQKANGAAHEFSSEEAREAGRKGGEAARGHEFDSDEAREGGRKAFTSRLAPSPIQGLARTRKKQELCIADSVENLTRIAHELAQALASPFPSGRTTLLRATVAQELAQAIASPVASELSAEPAPQVMEKHINAWISERSKEPTRPLGLGKRYTLNLGVGAAVPASLIRGENSTIPAKDLKGGGLSTEWIVSTSAFELASDDTNVTLPAAPEAASNLWEARFSLWIPEEGESDVRRLFIVPKTPQNSRLDILIFAVRSSSKELYRQFSVEVLVEGAERARGDAAAALVRDDSIYAPSAHMILYPAREWKTPPGRLNVTVLPGTLKAYVNGDLPDNRQVGEFVDWYAQQANLAGPITNVRDATEKFRARWEQYLNDIDAQDLLMRLSQFTPTYDWTHRCNRVDSHHMESWGKASKSQELHDLAILGHELYETVFPSNSELRIWMDLLSLGYRVNILWNESSGPGYVPNIPWGLMYLPKPPDSGEAVEPMGFLALRFRIGYQGYRGVQAPPKNLGSLANAHQAYCLYWGDHPNDNTGYEAVWQRWQFQNWQNNFFAPEIPGSRTAREEVLTVLSTSRRSPTSVIYLFCQASIGAGNTPMLRFGATSGPADILRTTDLLGITKELRDEPLVFANACTTSAADPYITNLLQQNLFRRGCRGFLGTETKVPIELASRFAMIFFYFFYRQADSKPMAAGEALAQTRLFLLTDYGNIGGIFYAYLNQFELYMADNDEVLALRG
jgi:hypothetical protein